MRIWKKVFAVVLCVALLVSLTSSKGIAAAKEDDESASLAYAKAMNPGWNLGNTFDSFDTGGDRGENSWGNPTVTKELIKEIKNQGFKSIRMPFTSVMRTGEAPNYTLDEKFLARYAEVVGWALDEGLYVMINLHHDSWSWAGIIGSDEDNGASMNRYKAIWKQLAEYFKDYSDKVCFESLNEPQFWSGDETNQIAINDTVNQEFYDLIRSSGGKNATRMLVLPTLNTNDAQARCDALYKMIANLKDDNILATFHYYGYWPFSTNIAGTTTMDETVVTELEAAFDRVHNTFVKNGIGVICGEYGLLGFDKTLSAVEHGEVLKYFEYINYYAKETNIPLMLWDNGQHMNRIKYEWSDKSLYDTIKASWTGRSSYTESDRVFVSDENKAKDMALKLFLNGNSFESITLDNKVLMSGTDYTVTSDTLTLKSSFIQSILKPQYGEVAKLNIKFSNGPDWMLYINYCSTPVIGEGSGNKTAFVIPVEFNGNVLSTLEAVKADGSGVGPQNWTSYKEYDYAFNVDYAKGNVIFTDKFFAEAEDSTVIVTYHFQNGTTAKSEFTIAGDKVFIDYKETVSNENLDDNKTTTENTEIKEVETKESEYEYYVVQKGDCLWNISKSVFGKGSEWNKIYEWNKDTIKNPDLIFIGQKLIIKK